MSSIKTKIKKHFPHLQYMGVFLAYMHDFRRFSKYSAVTSLSTREKLLGFIIAHYHVIEKGLTMKDRRLGFGKVKLLQLTRNCQLFIDKFGLTDVQVLQALSIITEYKELHDSENYDLDPEIDQAINTLLDKFENIKASGQREFMNGQYFGNEYTSFSDFALSRSSVRNYIDKEVPVEVIKDAIKLARTTPSACNRQSIRAHVYTKPEVIQKILDIQGGNRGFGHLTNKLIVITAEIGLFHGVYEINGPWIDGGMFAMNLIYALHDKKVATCPLNCNISPSKDKMLRKVCDINDSETFMVMISCGYVPDHFKAPFSRRYPVEDIMTVH